MRNKEDRIKQIFEVAKLTRTPISCSVEITQRCNFECPHCFIKDIGYRLLKFDQFTRFIDQFSAHGGIFISLTGGEVLLHPDFIKMYLYAHKKGLSVTVFTNGYLINNRIIELFSSFPPRKIEISMYGANENTYLAVTKQPGAYSKVIESIEALSHNKINVHLKSTLFRHNYLDLLSMKQFAVERQLPFRYDFKLMPKRNGEKSNLECQLSPNQIVEMEMEENEKKKKTWSDNYPADEKAVMDHTNRLFNCGAARYSCYLSSENQMRICAAATFSSQDMDAVTFLEAWKDYEKYTKLFVNQESKCIGCASASLCDICPIWGYIINDDIDCLGKEVELHCSLANERIKVLSNA
jgi:MoaA/NifB/PqqE/SkfB family radical SAM enzyme